jgi:hypothetical protein
MSAHTEQRKLTAIIPQDGTDRAGYIAMRRWVLPHSNDLDFGKDES